MGGGRGREWNHEQIVKQQEGGRVYDGGEVGRVGKGVGSQRQGQA